VSGQAATRRHRIAGKQGPFGDEAPQTLCELIGQRSRQMSIDRERQRDSLGPTAAFPDRAGFHDPIVDPLTGIWPKIPTHFWLSC
jgi:hypothetical protein